MGTATAPLMVTMMASATMISINVETTTVGAGSGVQGARIVYSSSQLLMSAAWPSPPSLPSEPRLTNS